MQLLSLHLRNTQVTNLHSFQTNCYTDPDLNAWSSRCTEPVAIRTETQGVDRLTASVKCVQVLALVQVPQHCLAVLEHRAALESDSGTRLLNHYYKQCTEQETENS